MAFNMPDGFSGLDPDNIPPTAATQKRPPVYAVPERDISEGTNGICLACGEIHYGCVEPDAENYECEACGKRRVFGIEQALLMGRVTVE